MTDLEAKDLVWSTFLLDLEPGDELVDRRDGQHVYLREWLHESSNDSAFDRDFVAQFATCQDFYRAEVHIDREYTFVTDLDGIILNYERGLHRPRLDRAPDTRVQ